jgi:hypothetical protein
MKVAAFGVLTTASAVTLLARDQDLSLKERPIMKVVRMLEDMKAELNKQLEDDKAVHEMMDCWCSTNEKEKTQSIEMGTARISELEATLGETVAKIKELKSKRKATQEEQYSDQDALGEATEIRMKENQEFHGAETDMLQAIDACKNAIVVLSKHNPELAQVKAMARMLQTARVPQMILKSGGALDQFRAKALKDFLSGADKAQESSFLGIPGMQSYAPQSGQVFGILKQMKEDFEKDLGEEQKSEAKAVEEFEKLKAGKEAEIETAKKAIIQFDQDLAALAETNAESMKELEDTEEQLANDKEFLEKLQEKCAGNDDEFAKRVASRMEEIAAVEDTIKILNDDEAFATFDKSVNSFVQISSQQQQQEQQRRSRASAVLQKAAAAGNSPKLALLAVAAQLDVFTEVKVEIDKMVAELKAQQADEIAFRDECIENLNTNKRETAEGYDKRDSLTTKIADLEQRIKTLAENIKSSKAAIAEAQTQMKRRSETREAENEDYQTTVQDQRLTQMILQKAIDRMSQVYALLQAPGAPHIQTSGTATDPGNGPAKFKDNAQENAGGKKVLAMLEDVMKDSRDMENEAINAEESAQNAYENFMKDSNKMIIQTSKMIVDMTEGSAKAKSDLVLAKTDLKQTVVMLGGLNDMAGDLHKSCDFLLENFDVRQEARAAEIDALGEAKNILSGMK